jgi:hypothetical protein
MPYVTQVLSIALSGNKTFARPTGLMAGDVMVMWVATDGNNSGWNTTFPNGWTVLRPKLYVNTLSQTGGDTGGLMVAYRVATSDEPASYSTVDTNGVNGNSGGLHVLRGVTAKGVQYQWTLTKTPLPTPFALPMRGLHLRQPSELLWVGSTDLGSSQDVIHTAPSGMRLIGDYNTGFNNFMIAHTRRNRGQTGPLLGYGSSGAGTYASLIGFLLAFPITPTATPLVGGTSVYSSASLNIRARRL